MSKKIAPNQGLPYGWERGEDHWGGPMSDSQVWLDSNIHMVIQSLTVSAPPANATAGAIYSVAANPTGVWAGHAGDVAVFVEDTWTFYKPKLGWRAYAKSYGKFIWYDGATWREEVSGDDPVNPDPDPSLKPKWFDICATVSDNMYANEPIIHLPIIDPLLMPANMAGSVFDMADVASKAYYQFRVQRNGQNVGTITIENGNYNATFATTAGNPISFGVGDRLTIRAQNVVVEGFKNFGFIIRMGIV